MATCPVCGTKGAERGVLCPTGCAYLVKDSALKVKAGGLERYLGKVIGNRYAVVGYLGRGGMGVVYRARDLRGTGEVALKVLLSASPSARARRRFLREAKVAARLRHPNVVVTYRFGRADSGFFLAMELVEGQPLSRFWRQGLPFDVLVEVCVQVLGALSAAHEAGVIHRDLKPANVLLSHTAHGLQVKVVDFGLARFSVSEDELTRTGELVGTPRYMSPEQARGSRDIGPETDLYALGVIMYEFISGQMLFEAESPTALAVMHITEPAPKLEPRKGVKIPTGFEAVLRKLLAKDPKARYGSAAAVRAALTPYLRGKQIKQTAAVALGDLSIDDRYAEEAVSRSALKAVESGAAWPMPGGIQYRTNFVGRDDIYNTMWEMCVQMVETGRGNMILVPGETGVGKSRLLEALKVRCFEELSMDWFVGESREGAGQGLWSLRQALSGLVGLRNEGHGDARKIIQSTLARWGTPAEDEINRLTDLLRPQETDAVLMVDHNLGDKPSKEDRQGIDRELLFGLVERVLRRAAAVHPTVIVFEDLHWAGLPTLQFLEYIIPSLHSSPAPLVLIATVSTDVEGYAPWADFAYRMRRYEPEGFKVVDVGRLDLESSRVMIEEMLTATDQLVDNILELTEGNPLHIIQVIRYLKEKNLIQEKSGTWDLFGEERLVSAVPPELADLLIGRLRSLVERHDLGQMLMRVIERCAIIGRQVPYELLTATIRQEEGDLGNTNSTASLIPRLDEALDLFIAEGVLDEGQMVEQEDILEFTHALLREVLNNNLKGRRATRSTHRAAARAKEQFYEGQLDAYAFQIAEHHESARDWSLALPWFARAAKNARMAWDLQTSLKLYLKAEAMIERIAQVEIELQRQIFEAQGEIYSSQGRYHEAAERLNRAYEVAEGGGGEPKVMAYLIFLRGDAARLLNDFDAAETCYRESLAVSRAVNDGFAVGRALLGLAKIFRIRHQLLKAHQLLTSAEEQFRALEDLKALADCSRQRAYIFMRAGRWKETRTHMMIALGLQRQFGDTHATACIQRDLARLSLTEGRIREAQLQTRKALDSFEGLGDRYGYAKTLSCLGEVYYALKQYQASKDLYNRALTIFETLESNEDMIVEMFHLGLVAFKRGRVDEAREWFIKAQDQTSNEQRSLRGIALAGQAWLAAHEDDIQNARTFMSRALPGLTREAFPIRDLAEIYDDCAECFQKHHDTILAEACRRWANDIRGGVRRAIS